MKMQFSLRGDSMSWFRDELVNNAYKFEFPIHKPYYQLTDDEKDLYGLVIVIFKD
jgi:excinuclease ABC subunit A